MPTNQAEGTSRSGVNPQYPLACRLIQFTNREPVIWGGELIRHPVTRQ
ncbi:MAG TPA: hypothetical protein VHY37_06705 [Tepidisphaeraceae bacterium]|nr:hypothetical protein [Tepidisphaeraceae bacterium]